MGQQGKDERELLVGERVAQAINSSQGTDYNAHPGEDPPDVVLKSEGDKFDPLELEIVKIPSTSVDMVDREENSNVTQLQNLLQNKLIQKGYQVSIHLTDKARRQGIPKKIVEEVVQQLEKPMQRAVSEKFVIISFPWENGRNEQPIDFIHKIAVFSLPNSDTIFVTFPHAMWLASDGKWIQDAVRKKMELYSPDAAAMWVLVVDGQSYVDNEQIKSFIEETDLSEFPFQQVWVVTSFDGVVRVK